MKKSIIPILCLSHEQQFIIFMNDELMNIHYILLAITDSELYPYSTIKKTYNGYFNFSNVLQNHLLDKQFQFLISSIMKSPIMKDYYSLNTIQTKDCNENLITEEKIEMNDSIISAYNSLNQLLADDTKRDNFFKENFYVMETPEGIKGYTNRYLLIILNCNGLQLKGLSFDKSKNVLFYYICYYYRY